MQGEWIRKPSGEVSVVFVHGILSSGESCWRHENGSFWPELLSQETALEQVGIYVFSYRTGVFSGNYRLGDAVDAIKEFMRIDGLLKSRQIFFVCHSMGGLVVRKFLVERAVELSNANIAIGLFLVASPSLGSSYANWMSRLINIVGNTQADALRFDQSNVWLNDLDKEFQNLKASGNLRITGKELIEDTAVALKKFWRKQVVEPFSGARYFGEPFKVPNSDHFSIAKPQGRRSIQHRLLVEFITQEMERERQHSTAAVSPGPLLASQTAPVSAEKNKNQGEANNGVGLGVTRTETKSDTESDTRILDDKISRAILQALGRHAPRFASVYSSAYAAAASAYSRKDRAVALATQAQSLLGAKIARLRPSKTNKRFLAVHTEEFGDLGMVLWNSGDQYFGQVSGKQETGLGVYKIYASTRDFDANSIATFEGEMHAGSFGPHGVYRFTSGTIFAGEWIDSRPKHGFESFLHETFPYEFYFGNIGITEDRLWLPHGKGISVSLKTSIITCGTFHFGVAVRDIETVTLDPDHD